MGLARLAWMPAALALIAPGAAEGAFAPSLDVDLEPPTAGQVPQVVAAVGHAQRLQRFTLRFPPGFRVNRDRGAVAGAAIGEAQALPTGTAPIRLVESRGVRTVTMLGGRPVRGVFEPGVGDTLHVTFDGLPLLPFGALRIVLYGGELGLVRTPSECGPTVVTGAFTSAAGEMALVQAPLSVTGCTEWPRASALRVRPRRFRPTVFTSEHSPGGVRLGWRLDRPAAGTRVHVERRAGRAWRRLGSVIGSGDAGSNLLRFDGRLRGRPLAPGVYHFVVQPRGGLAAASPRFAIVP